MSSSESEDSADDLDSDKYEDFSHLGDVNHLTSVLESNNNSASAIDSTAFNNIQAAFGNSSNLSPDGLTSLPPFNDSIRSYIEAPSLFQSTTKSPYYLSIDPTTNQSKTDQFVSDKLFVGNVVYHADWRDLKAVFTKLYYNVMRVDFQKNQTKNGHRGCAFVRFDSEHTANSVLLEYALAPRKIDEQDRKVSIIISYDSLIGFGPCSKYIFEWKFGALKGEKISPVLINNSSVGLLMEVKRPPLILHSYSSSPGSEVYKTRMPGTPSIGRANAWLFRLSGHKIADDYRHLFHLLCRYNLAPKCFLGQHILRSIHSLQHARECLRHVEMLSSDQWIKENHEIVSHFLDHRWPQYPFETKYEIMKLLSKHVITINDLIVDEQFDNILAKCSLNTLIACSDKIVKFAQHWLHDTCDHDDENWDEDEQEQQIEDQLTIPIMTENDCINNEDKPIMVHSATGESIDAKNTEIVFGTNTINRLRVPDQEYRFGYLSHFLMLALKQLQKKHELRQTTIGGVYVTKHELHTINSSSSLIRKVYITPSTILYEGPYREEKCLVTRHFENQQVGFLRVSFRDEDYRKLQYNNADMSKLYDRIKAILIDGIGICDRHFEFIAFSSSQLREHCCWMFSSMDHVSANSIRNWMGDFQKIRPVAKMAARLGQSFSTTRKGLELSRNQYELISDVKFGKSCFTDGIGIISLQLAKQLCQKLHIDPKVYRPCAFQIRFSGMVCLDVAQRITKPDLGLYLRPSMNKFDSLNRSIDIVRVASVPSAGFLNRQIILLLSSLGIKDEIFYSLQEQMLDQLRTLTVDHRKARDFLKQSGESSGNGYHGFLLAYLKRFGNCIDPFARQILLAIQAFHVKELRIKARIIVPNTWSLFGVVDETGTLRYGEVFVQTEQKTECGSYVSEIITGPIVVTRNPCFHPGDIRRLNAIDVPALHELKNVIVFPMHGHQSHPAEMSGGDLDGDTFWVSHEQRFLFENNEIPFDYHDQAMKDDMDMQLDTNINFGITDICKFFVEYIEADNLGMIANSHLAFADQSPLRAKAEKCLQLARMHSTAVDFAKNGVSAQRLTADLRPPIYPHFMEKRYKLNYHSETILGRLYDEVKRFENNLNVNREHNGSNKSSFPYQALIVDGSDIFMAAAMTTKNEYNSELKRVMRQYGIQSEAELVSGYILKFTTKQYSKQAKTFELRNEISHAVKTIQDKYLRIFYEEIYNHAHDADQLLETVQWADVSKKLTWKSQFDLFLFNSKCDITIDSEIMKKASAWFRVTYKSFYDQMKEKKTSRKRKKSRMANNREQNSNQHYQNKFDRLLSFAWIVYPILMKIYDTKHPSDVM
ncbi:unnamed protein product [Adineta steineri]|uniref:RNA-dependent RNA polymerase n=1 Tax=Adineta steineri TaxID=433720 RepID=A0A819TZC4_9BILA|nr:unnamed protein product [Adineta steineri]